MKKYLIAAGLLLLSGCFCIGRCEENYLTDYSTTTSFSFKWAPTDMPPIYCDTCGKDMVCHKRECIGESVIGITIDFSSDMKNEFFGEQFGIYKKRKYAVCLECWLKSLGVKP